MTPMTSTIEGAADQLMKQDRLGRVWTPAAKRAELVAEYDRSGMSGQQFAAYVGVKYPTFATWLAKAKKNGKATPAEAGEDAPVREVPSPVRWVEACVEGLPPEMPKAQGGPLVVQLPGGARLEIGDSDQATLAAELIRALGPGYTPVTGRSRRC